MKILNSFINIPQILTYDVRIVKQENIPAILALCDEMKSPENAEYVDYKSITEKRLEDCIEHGNVIALFDKEKLISFKLTYIDDYYIKYLPLILPENFPVTKQYIEENVTAYDFSCVHSDYRGKRLQYLMGDLVLRWLQEYTSHKYIITMISPKNASSLKNLQRLKFTIADLIIDPNIDGPRYIMYRMI